MATMTAYERVAAAVEQATGYRPPNERAGWRCPGHDDSHASLSITRGELRVRVHCHAGCETSHSEQQTSLTAS